MCNNKLMVKHEALEASVLNALQNYLMNPEALEIFCEEYTQHVNRMRMERNASIAAYHLKLEKIEKERKKLVDAIYRGVPGDQLKDDFIALAANKREIEVRLSETEEAPVLLHPRMANHYSDTVTRLISSLDQEGLKTESQALLRTMIDRIVLVPNSEQTALQIDLHGDLAGILKIAENSTKSATSIAHGALKVKLVGPETQQFGSMKVKLVGPEGLEPPTKPL
jgi:site-specific DNA recombinase